ncbi:hypothetical protein FB45DRAFT_272116 [Roridomyces roridus]|uniref:Uncharacterized protein n=1 Tax=Roridomyces roridus TaxID=1738132 RepID=A0AAD7B8F7_9AGAR|nr:hypothetical protein FB45DRAFT_272116 [Roridomyces roridus]
MLFLSALCWVAFVVHSVTNALPTAIPLRNQSLTHGSPVERPEHLMARALGSPIPDAACILDPSPDNPCPAPPPSPTSDPACILDPVNNPCPGTGIPAILTLPTPSVTNTTNATTTTGAADPVNTNINTSKTNSGSRLSTGDFVAIATVALLGLLVGSAGT